MSTDETNGRSDMERRVTDDDRGPVRAEEERAERRVEQERTDRDLDRTNRDDINRDDINRDDINRDVDPNGSTRHAVNRDDVDRNDVNPNELNRDELHRDVTNRDAPDLDRTEEGRTEGGTRPMRADETAYARGDHTAGSHSVTGGPAYAEGSRAVPGSARGRFHVGINWGAAFFGWIAAVGLAVILTAFIAAVGAAVGVTKGTTTVDQAANQLGNQDPQTVGVVGIILLAVIAFVSYYGGGYVAARMSRFDGPRQGFAVWLWAVIVAVVVAIVAAVAGAKFDVLSTLNSFPRLPVGQGDLTFAGILALVLLLAITLLGAMLGGAGGMRYHRKLESAEAEYLR